LQHLYLPILVLGFFAKPLGFTGGAKALTAFPEMTTSRGLSASFHHSGMEPKSTAKPGEKDPITSPAFAFCVSGFILPKVKISTFLADRCGSTNLLRVLCRLSWLEKERHRKWINRRC